MHNFLSGIGITVLAIVLCFGCFKLFESSQRQEAFEDTHFRALITCANCNPAGTTSILGENWKSFESGTILLGHTYTCGDCDIVGKLNEKNTLVPIKQKGE